MQSETQKAALRYERASSSHMAAKEMVRLAEEGLEKEGNILDNSWQEVLNHSTIRVNECERERVFQQLEHQSTSQAYNKCEQLVSQLHKQLKRSIVKARYDTIHTFHSINVFSQVVQSLVCHLFLLTFQRLNRTKHINDLN